MIINFWAVLVCGVIAIILGFIWYGPLFGKKWMEICGANEMDEAKKKEMQKAAMPLYIVQFLLALFQVAVLSIFVNSVTSASGLTNSLWIWAGFIIPTIASSCMWNNDSSKVKWTKFFIQGGYNLVLFVIFGIILGLWK